MKYIYHHLGLGDHIICNGLVRFIIKNYKLDELFLVVKYKNLQSVKNMYRDCEKIKFFCVNNDSDFYKIDLNSKDIQLIKVGFEKTRDDWDVSFYDSVDIPFEERWNSFYYKRDYDQENKLIETLKLPKKFILVHDTASIGSYDLKINTEIPIIKIQQIEPFDIFSWCGVAEMAEEVHCIDSSFIHLAEMLNIKQKYFHDLRNNKFTLKNNWNIVKKYND